MAGLEVVVQQLHDIWRSLLAHLPQIAIGAVVVALTWLISSAGASVLRRLLRRTRLRRSLVAVVTQLFRIAVWIAGVLLAATIVFPSLTPGKLITAVGLGSIAIGFAFKDIFENFVAGVLILFREPFRLGDVIQCDGLEGYVETITIRDTHVRQTDGQRVVIPNAALFKNAVVVRTDRDVRRTTVMCGVAYGEDVDEARAVIEGAVQGLDTVSDEHEVQIFAHGFGASSIDFEVTWWTGAEPIDIRRSRDQVVAAVKAALDEAGIEIPFPYRTLTFKEPLPLARAKEREGDSNRPMQDSERDKES